MLGIALPITVGFLFQYREWCFQDIGISFPISGMVFPRLEITLGFLFQYREWCFQDWKLHWDFFSNLGNGVSKMEIPLARDFSSNIWNGVSKVGNYIGISFPILGMVLPR